MIAKSILVKNWLENINPDPLPELYTSSPSPIKKRILFLEPRGAQANVFSFAMKYPLLGPVRMATTLRQHGYNAIMFHENIAHEDIPQFMLKAADILILTLLTQTCKRGYELADIYRTLRPDGKIIIGGIHPSFNVEEGLIHCDHLVSGEGDEYIVELMEKLFSGSLPNLIKTPHIADLTRLPTPDLNVVVSSHRILTKPVMTSWGCPFGCTFCCVTSMYGKGYRRFSHDQTIDAIRQYHPRRVFFLDDNLCADKPRALELFKRLKDLKQQGFKFMWIAQVRADLAKDEEFIKQMALANCRRVFIGFESIVQDSLNDVVKNVTIETYINAIRIFHKYGIPIHGMFIFGLDHDQKTVFKNTVDFCHKYGIESAQFLMITPFPGTKYYDELDKKRLLTTDTDLYDGNHVLVQPLNMTAREMFDGMVWSYSHLYSWISILKQFGRDLRNFHRENIRSVGYRIRKMFNNFFRNIGFRIILRRLKWITRIYKKSLPN